MNLQFSKHMKVAGEKKPTFFKEKIWSGLVQHEILERYFHDPAQLRDIKQSFGVDIRVKKYKPKLHTFREDKNDHWNDERIDNTKIDFYFNLRNANSDAELFAPRIPFKGWQSIKINALLWHNVTVEIDGHQLLKDQIEELARNDGFDSMDDFLAWFGGGLFVGKIIHWTEFRYISGELCEPVVSFDNEEGVV